MRSVVVAALFTLSLAACTKASSPANEAPTPPHPELVARFDPARVPQSEAAAKAVKAELARAQQTIVEIRNILLLEKFSQADIAAWQKYREAYLQNPLSVPGEVRPRLTALEPWMTTTVADER